MNVDLNKTFSLEHEVDHAWKLLSDIEAVAECMPGAEIIEVVDETHFKGKVKIKLGPVNMAFNGDITVQGVNAAERQIHLIAEGQDNKGTSTATMDLKAHISEVSNGAGSDLIGDAKVIVNGKLASFGQRMMAQVSDQILNQFADNFRAKLASDTSANSVVSADADDQAIDRVNASSAGQDDAPAEDAAPIVKNEINGFKFALQAIVGLITGLFKGRKG